MARKAGSEDVEESDVHGNDRPWVFFMIDCFFLVTQFFVITFKVKADEVILPQRLPPGSTRPIETQVNTKEQINVHVMKINGVPTYIVMNVQNDINQFSDALAAAAARGPERYTVRISYAADVPFGAIMAIFNSCAKVKIAECGLIPLRTGDRPGV